MHATVLLLLTVCVQVSGQPAPGTIAGTIVESRTRAPLTAVLVMVEGTDHRALSQDDGRFEIQGVVPGRHMLMVSVVGYGLVRRAVIVEAGRTVEVLIMVSEGGSSYVEEITVPAPAFRDAVVGVPGQAVLGVRDLLALRGVVADDPFRAVQVLPAVATGDDFRGEFSVRGHGPAHLGLALDGVDTPLLFHTVRGVEDTGSLALINSDILESATLLTGAYPQRAGAHLGARLDFASRDGSRDRLAARVLVSGTAATTVWDGPLGSGRHGSWLIAARQSYLDWLLRKVDPDVDGTFGFTDMQGRAMWTLSPHQWVRAWVVAGRSQLRERDEDPGPNSLDRASSRTVIANLQWRYSRTPRLVVEQQAYVVDNRYRNLVLDGRPRQEGMDRDFTWRASIGWSTSPRHQFEVGGQAQWSAAERVARRFTASSEISVVDARDSYDAVGAWVNYRWTVGPSLVLTPGARVDRSGLADAIATSPWVSAEWALRGGWRLRASAGGSHQAPSFDQVAGAGDANPLEFERAGSIDVGVERRIADRWRVNVVSYYRSERNRLRLVNGELRVAGGNIVLPSSPHWDNVLDGEARGVELTIERRSQNGLTGWIGYGLGRSELEDRISGESFPSDFDQQHTLNLYALYRWSDRTSFSGRFRYGSNFPLPGYYEQIGSDYYLTTMRNTTRLPAYARVDLRADRTFTLGRRRLTLFVEVLNVLNRENVRFSDPTVNPITGRVRGAVETLFPLLPSAGVLVEF
jgi:hypothetical protein